MHYLFLTLSWVFGVLLLIIGLALVIDAPIAGLCYLAAALVLLPPSRQYAQRKFSVSLTTAQRTGTIIVLLVASSYFHYQSDAQQIKEMAEQKAQEAVAQAEAARQEKADFFRANREEIMASVTADFEQENYQAVIDAAKPYLPAQDPELTELSNQAHLKLVEIQKAERLAREKAANEKRTKEIVSQLKGIPVSSFRSNQRLYKELVEMNPDVEHYQEKLAFYDGKIAEQEAKEKAEQQKRIEEREARIAAFGKPPTQSAWDGSYYPVERYLERIANDPDSIDISGCTKVYHTKNGWLVGCDYRGRNAFGGMVRQSNWFTIVRDTVIQMHDSGDFSP